MKITKRQLRRIIREEKARLLEMDRDTLMAQDAEYYAQMNQPKAYSKGPFRHPKTGEDMFLMLNDIVDKLLDAKIDPMQLARELDGIADDVRDSV